MLDILYRPYREEMAIFGDHWCGPDELPHWDWTLVARYYKDPGDGDGFPVEVDVSAAPARFYRIRALGTPDSTGNERAGFVITFGSGMAELADRIAKEIVQGMLTARPEAEAK